MVLIINPRRACAARVTVLGLSVCLSVRRLANLAVQGTGRPMTATNHFRVARSLILIGRFSRNDCVREIWREDKLKSQLSRASI